MRRFLFPTLVAVAWLSVTMVAIAAARQHDAAAHVHAGAQALKNPVTATPESVAAGEKLFTQYCAECHGDEGRGDGMEGDGMDPPPANLTDRQWKHGSTDGEIFAVVRDGTRDGMKAFKKKLTPDQIWNIVNYVRTFGPKPAKSH